MNNHLKKQFSFDNIEEGMKPVNHDSTTKIDKSNTKDETSATATSTEEATSSVPSKTSASPDNITFKEDPEQSPVQKPHSNKKRNKIPLVIDTTNCEEFDMKSPKTKATSPMSQYTEATSPSTIYLPQTPPTVVIENKAAKKSKGGGYFFSRYRKHIIGLLFAYALVATGAGSYMFSNLLRIPGLDDQIDDLSHEVDRLEKEVDNLSGVIDTLHNEIDRLESEINKMETNNLNLERNIFDLKNENNVTKVLLKQMDESNEEYKRLNIELHGVNTRYAENNEYLNQTVQDLAGEVSTLNIQKINLNTSVSEYKVLNKVLELEVKTLSNITGNLTSTVDELNDSIDEFKDENSRFRKLNQDLTVIVSFLNNTADDLTQSYEYLVSTLAEQMAATLVLMKENMHNRYLEQLTDWDCELSNRFRLQPFARDEDVPIGDQFYDRVITHLDTRLLHDLCVDKEDFQLFLINEKILPGSEVVDISMTLLKEGVSQYVSEVLNYYFPDGNESGGLNDTDWHTADYSCAELPQDKKFIWRYNVVDDAAPKEYCTMKSIDICV